MITTTTELGTSYHHNGDYSGEIMFNVRVEQHPTDAWHRYQGITPLTDGARGTSWDYDQETGYALKGSEHEHITIMVPFRDMLELVLNKLRTDAMVKLEMATTDELITMLTTLGRN